MYGPNGSGYPRQGYASAYFLGQPLARTPLPSILRSKAFRVLAGTCTHMPARFVLERSLEASFLVGLPSQRLVRVGAQESSESTLSYSPTPCHSSPIGRGTDFKRPTVWVRIPGMAQGADAVRAEGTTPAGSPSVPNLAGIAYVGSMHLSCKQENAGSIPVTSSRLHSCTFRHARHVRVCSGV